MQVLCKAGRNGPRIVSPGIPHPLCRAVGDVSSTATKGLSKVLVDIALKKPEVIHVRGPSGSGKSTLRHSVVKHLKEREKFVIDISIPPVGPQLNSPEGLYRVLDRLVVRAHPHLPEIRSTNGLIRLLDDPHYAHLFDNKDVAIVVDDAQRLAQAAEEALGGVSPSSAAKSALAKEFSHLMWALQSYRSLNDDEFEDVSPSANSRRFRLGAIIVFSDCAILPNVKKTVVNLPMHRPVKIQHLLEKALTAWSTRSAIPLQLEGATLRRVATEIYAYTLGHPGQVDLCVKMILEDIPSAIHNDPPVVDTSKSLKKSTFQVDLHAIWRRIAAQKLFAHMLRRCPMFMSLTDAYDTRAIAATAAPNATGNATMAAQDWRPKSLVFVKNDIGFSISKEKLPELAWVEYLRTLGALRELRANQYIASSPLARSAMLFLADAAAANNTITLDTRVKALPQDRILEVVSEVIVLSEVQKDMLKLIDTAFHHGISAGKAKNTIESFEYSVMASFYQALSGKMKSQVDSVLVTLRPEFVPLELPEDVVAIANAPITAKSLFNRDGDEEDDEYDEDDEEDEAGGPATATEANGKKKQSKFDALLEKENRPVQELQQARAVLDIRCRPMIVMDKRKSTFGAVTARDLVNQRVVLEFASVDCELASEKGGVRAELQKKMNMLGEYRRNCDGREAWLVVVSQLSLQELTAQASDLIPPEGVHCVAITAPPAAAAAAAATPGAADATAKDATGDVRTLTATQLC